MAESTPALHPDPGPKSVLMIKSHSLGVGDLLRSSAAWRVMKNAWPSVQLHLLFLSKHPGYPTQDLIAGHHLLSSAHFITLREGSPQHPGKHRVKMSHILTQVRDIAQAKQVDWVIDFEMNGLRTAWLTWALRHGAKPSWRQRPGAPIQTLGVNQFWPRAWFYANSSVSLPTYMQQEGLTTPMDYTHRDFVVLSALGLKRGNTPIELHASEASVLQAHALLSAAFQDVLSHTGSLHPSPRQRPVWGINIGCGTPDALGKRPHMSDLVASVVALAQRHSFDVVLTGAAFEREVNEEFIQAFNERMNALAHPPVHMPLLLNAAGTGSLRDLSGLITCCELFLSTDSGPYHMAVGLKVSTLVWFVIDQPASYHGVSWCKRVVNPSVPEVLQAVERLIG